VCLQQVDMKKVIAYSSIVHIGPVFSSIFFIRYFNLVGAYMIIVSHGLCSSALFLIMDLVYKQIDTRRIFILRGGIRLTPILSFFWFFFCIRNI